MIAKSVISGCVMFIFNGCVLRFFCHVGVFWGPYQNRIRVKFAHLALYQKGSILKFSDIQGCKKKKKSLAYWWWQKVFSITFLVNITNFILQMDPIFLTHSRKKLAYFHFFRHILWPKIQMSNPVGHYYSPSARARGITGFTARFPTPKLEFQFQGIWRQDEHLFFTVNAMSQSENGFKEEK